MSQRVSPGATTIVSVGSGCSGAKEHTGEGHPDRQQHEEPGDEHDQSTAAGQPVVGAADARQVAVAVAAGAVW